MAMSSLTVDQSTGSQKRKGSDLFDIEGMVFPLLKPTVTTRPAQGTMISCSGEQQKDDFLADIGEVTVVNEQLAKGDQDGCETPKSEEHKIPNVLECPPAPRKHRLKPKMNISSFPERFFFFPPDLDSAFVVYRMSPPRKKLQ